VLQTKKTSKPGAKKSKTPASNYLTSPVTQDVVDTTTSSFPLLGDLSWLFTQVHFAALLVSILLVLKVSCDTHEKKHQSFESVVGSDGGILGSIKRTAKNGFKSLGKPKMQSMFFVSLLICRYVPLNFTVESFFSLNKNYNSSATVKFTRLVAAFYFASYIYRERLPFMEDSDPMPPFKHFLIAISLGCLSYFLPVISVSVAALGELISFYWSKDNDSKPELFFIKDDGSMELNSEKFNHEEISSGKISCNGCESRDVPHSCIPFDGKVRIRFEKGKETPLEPTKGNALPGGSDGGSANERVRFRLKTGEKHRF